MAAKEAIASGGDRFHRRHHRQHDRQIEVAAFFRQIGRRQIDCNVLEGQAKTDGVQRVADTLAAFGDGFNPNERERGNLAAEPAPTLSPLSSPASARSAMC